MISTQYRTLCSVRTVHNYYTGQCPCFEPVITADAAREAKRARLLFKQLNGALHVLYEADAVGAPRVVGDGLRLSVGLKLVEPAFCNITEPEAALAAGFATYDNRSNAAVFSAATPATLVGNILVHPLEQASRPLAVRVLDADGGVLAEQTVTQDASVSFELDDFPMGSLTVEEGGIANAKYYRQPELQAAGALLAVDIDIDASFYTAPPSFEIAFQARSQPLNY